MATRLSDDQKAESALKLLTYLETIRFDYESTIEDIFTFVYPGRRHINDKDNAKGMKTGQGVYDNTAQFALNTVVDGSVGYLCSRNQQWFRFTIPGNFNFQRSSTNMRGWTGRPIKTYPQVRQWLQDCAESQYSALNRSNFYDQIPEGMRDGAGVGTAHIFCEEDIKTGKIVFTVPHFRECFIAEDQHGRVDTNFRKFKMTLRSMDQKFGLEKLTAIDSTFNEKYENDPYEEEEIVRGIFPREDRDPSKMDINNAPIASLWIWPRKKKLLLESGYRWMPSISWRWRKNNDEIYGRGLAHDAFVDILLANGQGKDNLEGGHKMVNPPMASHDTMRGKVHIGPGAWTYFDSEQKMKMTGPIQTIANLPYAVEMQSKTSQAIKDHFGEPFFNVLTQAAMQKTELTATQVIEITGERASILSTRVGRMESELFSPIHDRVFEIEARAGRMPEPPPILRELAGGALMGVEYLGVLSQVRQQMTEVKKLMTFFNMIGQIAQFWPPALDRVDGDTFIDKLADKFDFDMECMSTEERTAQIRQARAQQQQQQQKVEAMGPTAKLLRAAGPKPEPGSPAQQLLNPEEGQQPGA